MHLSNILPLCHLVPIFRSRIFRFVFHIVGGCFRVIDNIFRDLRYVDRFILVGRLGFRSLACIFIRLLLEPDFRAFFISVVTQINVFLGVNSFARVHRSDILHLQRNFSIFLSLFSGCSHSTPDLCTDFQSVI